MPGKMVLRKDIEEGKHLEMTMNNFYNSRKEYTCITKSKFKEQVHQETQQKNLSHNQNSWREEGEEGPKAWNGMDKSRCINKTNKYYFSKQTFVGAPTHTVRSSAVPQNTVTISAVPQNTVNISAVPQNTDDFCGAAEHRRNFCGTAEHRRTFCGTAKHRYGAAIAKNWRGMLARKHYEAGV